MSRTTGVLAFGLAAAAALGALCAGSLLLMSPVAVEPGDDPPFVALVSDQTGGSTLLDVATHSPIDLSHPARRVQVDFTIMGESGTTPTLVLGGSLAKSSPDCVGAGFGKSSATPTKTERRTLVDYVQRRPGTGYIDWTGASVTSTKTAEKSLTDEKMFVFRKIALTNLLNKSWTADKAAAPRNLSVQSAVLSCTFNQAAFVNWNLYRSRVRAPDVVASAADPGGAGPVDVSYEFEVQSDQNENEFLSTFGQTTRRVDASGAHVVSYGGEWWVDHSSDFTGISVNGGSSVLEPSSALQWRAGFRLAAGFFASLTVACMAATLVYAFSRTRWWTVE